MSMELMVMAMKAKVGNPIRKLVLLKLADNANEDGQCWPSMANIAAHCETSKRTVQRHIDDLVTDKLIIKEFRTGTVKGNTSNLYTISKEKLSEVVLANPNKNAKKPSDTVTPPLMSEDHPPSDTVSPPLVTQCHPESVIMNQSLESKKIYKKKDFSNWPELPNIQTLDDWLDMRSKKRAPVSQTVINRFAKELNLAVQQGFTVDDCIAECVVKGWVGFEADWMKNVKSISAKGQFSRATVSEHNSNSATEWLNQQDQISHIEGPKHD